MPHKKKFEYGKGADGQFYCHLKGGNGEIVVQAEDYSSQTDCLHVFDVLCQVNRENTVVVKKRPKKRSLRLNRSWP